MRSCGRSRRIEAADAGWSRERAQRRRAGRPPTARTIGPTAAPADRPEPDAVIRGLEFASAIGPRRPVGDPAFDRSLARPLHGDPGARPRHLGRPAGSGAGQAFRPGRSSTDRRAPPRAPQPHSASFRSTIRQPARRARAGRRRPVPHRARPFLSPRFQTGGTRPARPTPSSSVDRRPVHPAFVDRAARRSPPRTLPRPEAELSGSCGLTGRRPGGRCRVRPCEPNRHRRQDSTRSLEPDRVHVNRSLTFAA